VSRLGLTLVAPFAALVLASATPRGEADAGDEGIRLTWAEGDVAGMGTIFGADGIEPIGSVEYRQTVRGDRLSSVRIARFADGSSDEDWAEARVGARLEALAGRSILRDAHGESIADIRLDVAGGRIAARWRRGPDEQQSDERVALPPDTYWGPLIFLVVKNFDANATDDRVVFRTVAPTPRPYVLDMELRRADTVAGIRGGVDLPTVRFDLRPKIHWAVDPVLRLAVSPATFFVLPGNPPGLLRFAGPRNYTRQPIRIE
jgi:hypothetical protein